MNRIDELYEELKAVQYVMNVSRTWAGNERALQRLDEQEATLCNAINSLR